METIERITSRHAAELAAAVKASELAAQLPKVPDRMMGGSGLGYWLTYDINNLSGVTELIRLYAAQIVPTVELRNGCLERKPLELHADPATAARDGTECVFSLDVDQGRGFGPSCKFYFYAQISGQFVKVIAQLPDNWRASARLDAPVFDLRGHPATVGTGKSNLILQSLFHSKISWSPNTAGLDACFTYTLIDSAPYTDTLDLLENSELTAWWKI